MKEYTIVWIPKGSYKSRQEAPTEGLSRRQVITRIASKLEENAKIKDILFDGRVTSPALRDALVELAEIWQSEKKETKAKLDKFVAFAERWAKVEKLERPFRDVAEQRKATHQPAS